MAESGREREDLDQEITTGHGDSPGLLVVDWARYEGQFDRMDGAMRHRMACLIAWDGVLFLVLTLFAIGPMGGFREYATLFVALLPWLGLSVSIMFYWAQYRTHEHRRELQRFWKQRYPEVEPTPYGLESRDPGTLVGSPSVLFALLSSVFWLLVLVYRLAGPFVPNVYMATITYVLPGILGCVTIVVFYCVSVMHFANKDGEQSPPRKW